VSNAWWLRLPAYAYIFFFRGTPLLVQIFLIYYGLGQFESVRTGVLWPIVREPFWCAIIAFALNTGAYTAEILRGAIQAVPVGEVEAARAFGMSTALMYRRIVLPRALRIAFPAYGNEIILMLKGSALASTITLLDLTGMARTIIARTYMPVEIFLAAGAIYLAITFVFTRLFALAERRLNRHLAAAR
jgi:polar amino acid transport system permease protein